MVTSLHVAIVYHVEMLIEILKIRAGLLAVVGCVIFQRFSDFEHLCNSLQVVRSMQPSSQYRLELYRQPSTYLISLHIARVFG